MKYAEENDVLLDIDWSQAEKAAQFGWLLDPQLILALGLDHADDLLPLMPEEVNSVRALVENDQELNEFWMIWSQGNGTLRRLHHRLVEAVVETKRVRKSEEDCLVLRRQADDQSRYAQKNHPPGQN